MPYLGGSFSMGPSRLGGPQVSAGDARAAANMVTKQDRSWFTAIGGSAVLGVADLADTVASSIPGLSSMAGIKRGDINQAMLNAVDSPGFNDFYRDYQGAIEATSGIYGVVASELLTRRFTKPAGLLMKTLQKIPGGRRIATLDDQYTNAMNVVRQTDLALARRGALGVEQYAGRVTLSELGEGVTIAGSEVSRKAASRGARFLGAAKGARDIAMTEVTMGVLLNQNGFLYDDDAAHNIMWMGLGLGIGSAFEWVHTGYKMRKAVNSDEIRRAYANALDPDMSEEARLRWRDRGLLKAEDETLGFLGGQFTDQVTSLLVSAKNLTDSPVGDGVSAIALAQNREALATQHLKLAEETIQKVTTKGISSSGYTRFDMEARGYGNHVSMLLKRDAGAMHNIEVLGGVPDELTGVGIHESHMNRLQERIDSIDEMLDEIDPEDLSRAEEITELTAFKRRLEHEKNLTPIAFIDGERATLSDMASFDGWVEPDIVNSKVDSALVPDKKIDLWEVRTESPKGGPGVDSNLDIYLPGNVSLDKADHNDILRLYRVANRAIENLKTKAQITVPDNATWFQLDIAEEILQRSGNRVKVLWPKGLSRETAQVESFAQKALAIRNEVLKRKNEVKKVAAGKKIRGKPPLTEEEVLSRMRVRYNLPKLSAYERGVLGTSEHPIEGLLRGAGDVPDEIRKVSLPDLKKAIADYKRIGDIQPVSAKDIESLSGTSFRFMLDESGKPIKPLLGYARPFAPHEWTKDNIAERMAARKIQVMGFLAGPNAAPTTQRGATAILSSPDFDAASRTHELMETQVQGSLVGAANQGPWGTAGKSVIAREMRDRDSPIMLAASRLQNMVQTMMRGELKDVSEKAFGDTLAVLDSPRNVKTKLLLNQFHSYRGGWDLAWDSETKMTEFAVRETPDGGVVYAPVLDTTEKNKERWRQFYGTEMPAGQTLVSPNGTEVVLDELGLDIQNRFNLVTERLRQEKNTLNRSQGLREIERVELYTPPPSIQGKFVGFTMGPDNQIIPGGTIITNTQEEFNRQLAELRKSELLQTMGNVFRTRDQIQDFASIWDRAQMDMIDPGTTAIQGGKGSRGALSGMNVDVNAFDNALANVRDQFLRHGNDMIEVIMRDQINAAKARANIAGGVTRNRAGFYRDQKYRSIHDMYLENLLGRSPLSSPGSLAGRFYNTIEGTIDSFLTASAPTLSRTGAAAADKWQALNAWLDPVKPWSKEPTAKRDFESLTAALGEHMPFKSAVEMAEARGLGSAPKQLADLMGVASRFTAAVMLRMLETAMPVMNLAGMVNAMPAVIRHFGPRAGESAAEYSARIGHSANIFTLPDGRSIGTMDMGKIATRAFSKAWTRDRHPDYAYMVRNGYLTQEVAEFQRQFGSIETKKDWERFMFGDPAKAKEGGIKGKFAEKGLIGWMSIATDKSEDFSRSWGHMVGLEIAETLGIKRMAAKHQFAHDIANKMIANYNPHNRPEVFQGAVGSLFGLFQSFIMNYYARMFRYIETKDYRSLATQYATQAGLFGVTTVPGWNEMNNFFFDVTDGEGDPTTGIHERFGQSAGDLIFGGVISNIPKLFGLGAVDLYSRGDTAVRLPGINLPPALTMGTKILQGLGEGIQAFWGDNPALSGTQVAEIVSNMMPNRPIAGMIEQWFASGNDTDNYGQLVVDTKSRMESVYRILGTRSMRQSRELEAFYSNKSAMEEKASKDDILRTATRSAIRAGKFDSLPAIGEQYIQNGGDPRYFRRWLRTQYEAATETRAERQLDDVLNNPQKMDMVMRLLDANVGIEEDEQTTGYDQSLSIESDFDQLNPAPLDYGGQTQMLLE